MAPRTATTSLFEDLFGDDWPPAGATAAAAGRPVILERRGCRDRSVRPSGRPSDVGMGGERTLDDVIVGAWEALTAQLATACPVCDGQMVPGAGLDGQRLGGRCRDCGTELA